jgi:hypothetical protein
MLTFLITRLYLIKQYAFAAIKKLPLQVRECFINYIAK